MSSLVCVIACLTGGIMGLCVGFCMGWLCKKEEQNQKLNTISIDVSKNVYDMVKDVDFLDILDSGAETIEDYFGMQCMKEFQTLINDLAREIIYKGLAKYEIIQNNNDFTQQCSIKVIKQQE